MTDRTTRLLVAASALALSASLAWAQDRSPQEQRMAQLESKIATLEAKQAESSKDMAATIDSMLRDAEKRSQLMAISGGNAGYDNGFFIASDDKSFLLRPSAQFQPRYVVNWRENVKADDSGSTEDGFELRRMKFGLEGNVFSRDLTYNFLWATNRNTGGLVLEEGWARYMFADEWGVRAGQFKAPVAHEGLVSSKRLLAAEHSYLQDTLGVGDNFVQGATLIYGNANSPLHVEAGYTDGQGSANTDFTNTFASGGSTVHNDFGIAGRAEYKLLGDWKSYQDMTALGNNSELLVIGAGGDWTERGDSDILLHTADIQYETAGGLALYAAFLGRAVQNGDSPDFYDWGALGQVAYLFDKDWEIFGRYDYTGLDEDALAPGSNGHVHEITVGMNYYWHGQAAKLTVDLTYLPNGAPIADTGADILKSDDNELLLRVQFQLLI